ncbi:MAG: retropepsin-like domain-containing protein [Selenomonadaceae bacterium]|nr:retropepsin-like domain-containing protein [Selenomonadaceae bacterium]
MKQFTLELSAVAQRPIAILNQPNVVNAMLDTGALFPIWVDDEKWLCKLGGTFERADVPFGGFGGMTKGNLYRIPNFCVGQLVFPQFPVIASPRKLPCQILLSATMFSNLIYEIDDKNHRLNFTIPDEESLIRPLNVRIENGRLHIFCTSE